MFDSSLEGRRYSDSQGKDGDARFPPDRDAKGQN